MITANSAEREPEELPPGHRSGGGAIAVLRAPFYRVVDGNAILSGRVAMTIERNGKRFCSSNRINVDIGRVWGFGFRLLNHIFKF